MDYSLNNQVIFFIGTGGVGKTTIGRSVADHLSTPFFDSDHVIEDDTGQTIPDIFARHGEPYFRKLERDTISRLARQNQAAIIVLGGGAFMDPATRATIKENGISVFLRADIDVLLPRIGNGEGRPMLQGGDVAEKLQTLIDQRYDTYAKADIVVDILDEPIEQSVHRVLNALYSHQKD